MSHEFNRTDSGASHRQLLLASLSGRLHICKQFAGHLGVWCAAFGYSVNVLIHGLDGRVPSGHSRFKRGSIFSRCHGDTLPQAVGCLRAEPNTALIA